MFLPSVMLHLRWLFLSPTVCHELFKLELPWAWEPPASSRAFRIGESKRPQGDFSHGNEEEEVVP